MLEQQFEELRNKVNKFIDQTEESTLAAEEKAKESWQETKNELVNLIQVADQKNNELKSAGEQVSEELKNGAQQALDDLTTSFELAEEKFSNM